MAKLNAIYKCEVCGNVVSVLEEGAGTLVCCGQDMTPLKEKSSAEEQGSEKHVPVIEKTDAGILVKVGENPHPMEEKHYIGLIQLMKGANVVIGKRLKPGDEPKAEFCCLTETEGLSARIFCNIHGVWVNS